MIAATLLGAVLLFPAPAIAAPYDKDDDGIADSREINFTKTNPDLADTDNDGLSDG